MQDFWKDVINPLKERISDPFLGYLTLFFLLINWKIGFYILNYDQNLNGDLFRFIEKISPDIRYVMPIGLSLIMTIAYPYIAAFFVFTRRYSIYLRNKFENEKFPSVESYKKINELYDQQKSRISNLESQFEGIKRYSAEAVKKIYKTHLGEDYIIGFVDKETNVRLHDFVNYINVDSSKPIYFQNVETPNTNLAYITAIVDNHIFIAIPLDGVGRKIPVPRELKENPDWTITLDLWGIRKTEKIPSIKVDFQNVYCVIQANKEDPETAIYMKL